MKSILETFLVLALVFSTGSCVPLSDTSNEYNRTAVEPCWNSVGTLQAFEELVEQASLYDIATKTVALVRYSESTFATVDFGKQKIYWIGGFKPNKDSVDLQILHGPADSLGGLDFDIHDDIVLGKRLVAATKGIPKCLGKRNLRSIRNGSKSEGTFRFIYSIYNPITHDGSPYEFEYGCYKGYCWASCTMFSDWCYTTRSYSQSYRYVKCRNKSECSGQWKCAGPCSVGN